ncbi:MAG: glycosyltransferase family 2 protein [Psychroflexus sp.]|uniref:glycosyltransferase family 2 protein n=1 Tax=Psychroflexus sp. S27 TaxID=1982757 RepID=UPI000C2993AC|nr:glycosyltransferase family 2 protein [Psychroflexus sp. S27]PJX24008.1 dTDP-Rha--alpha-D-GlcNAc-pyrophosphate polyprenol alpha-3-L-rhamnosyltransferase [Psychroflexus sp. S27]
MKTAVVILNWNGRKLLKEFLPSVVSHSQGAKIYVIDNASIDDSVSFLKKEFPEVFIIQNKENYGFAGGYNHGLKHVKEKYWVLLNSDVEVTPNWITPLIKTLESSPNIAAVQPKIKSYLEKNKFEYAGAAGGLLDKLAYPYCRGRIFDIVEEDHQQYDENCRIMWASGACFAVKKEIYENLGGFDEDYFAHQEEIDLCWRMHNFGFEIWYTFESEVFHLGGGTLNYNNPRKTYLNFRNSLYNIIKNTPKHTNFLILQRFMLDVLASLKFLFAFQIKNFFTVYKAYFSMILNFNKMKNKRKNTFSDVKYYKIKSIVWHRYFKGRNHESSIK